MSESKFKEKLSSKIQLLAKNLFFASLLFGGFAGFSSAQTGSVEQIRDLAATPEKLSASFSGVAKRVEAAVVNIDTKGKVPEVALKGENPSGRSDDILDFLRRQMPSRPSAGVGSGFIVDKSGYILTNHHVVEEASRISVKLQSGEEFVAKVVGFDEETDLAVLKISAGRELPFIKFGNSDAAEVGDWVLAIGSPFGLAQTVTAGIVSQTRRETPYASVFQKFIQTDASINRGNSGGPLVNMNAEVIGINSQIATTTGDSNGIGFALPSNEAANVYRQILAGGRVRRGYLGVLLDSVKPEFAKVYNLPEAKGAIITELRDRQSAAGKAGLQTGDIITEFDGKTVQNAADLIQKVASATPEREVNVTFFRETGTQVERRTTVIKLGERPSNNRIGETDEPKKLPVGGQKTAAETFGLTLSELTPQLAPNYRTQGGRGVVVKKINPASFIADVKASNGADALNEGDLIQRVNRVSVSDLKTFNDTALKLKTGDAVVLHVVSPLTRGAQMRIVQFTVQ
ncbi:MAG TPA: trypsin-like peptidase domain-containing protein [Pyrinomonadaceae bacterium]|nr:trypsin-like peptidase domain-containing protein [Pyrinomonadaceae bacterium]